MGRLPPRRRDHVRHAAVGRVLSSQCASRSLKITHATEGWEAPGRVDAGAACRARGGRGCVGTTACVRLISAARVACSPFMATPTSLSSRAAVHVVELGDNFHLPDHAVDVVSAFAGYPETMAPYGCRRSGYRFFSYGDSSSSPEIRATSPSESDPEETVGVALSLAFELLAPMARPVVASDLPRGTVETRPSCRSVLRHGQGHVAA